ncbi:MAG TPA: crotonase/enoyl-CoA hydratase family protein [Rhizomicrobium sp.]|jgi:enoyl-CoA hydratase/carnithine racemase|nr:crotonase/enoyl-CoA hydratase family protein [Rhizomicrobium sp.]
MTDRVTVNIENGVADVRLVRTDKMNALDLAMFHALIETGEMLKRDVAIRAVVISGEGRAFCAGLDMMSFAQMADAKGNRTADLAAREFGIANRAQQAVFVWRQIPVPVIAAIHGVAFGGGFQLTLGADMRYIAADAKMSVMEVKWGLVPDMTGILLMPELARNDVIREFTYTGRVFSGTEALAYGFATRVCDDPRAEALATAREIAGKSPHAIRAAKRLLNLSTEADPATILRVETEEQVALIGSPNQIEAVMANMQKREPKFADPAA